METKDGVTLEPFVHQVGGHSGMMKYDEATVCKPLSPAELHFYETLTPEIAQFTPDFKGVVHVSVQEDDDGSLSVRAYPLRAHHQPTSPLQPRNTAEAREPDQTLNAERSQKANKLHRSSKRKRSWPSHSKDGPSTDDLFEDHSEGKTTPRQLERGNPWGAYLNQLQLAKMHRDVGSGKFHKFILLENLTSRFRSPCILDIKLGTRTYRMDHSEEKRKMHIDRDAATTTASLGLRICGMQVYQPNKGCYKCRNKYDGRRLTKDGIRKTLSEYLFNGNRVRTELIPPFLERVNAVIRAVSTVTSQSFLSSSLLLIYEGDPGKPGGDAESSQLVLDLRIIDFGSTAKEHGGHDSNHECNQGCVYGLRNLKLILSDIEGAPYL